MAHKTLISGTAYSVTGRPGADRRHRLRLQSREDPHRRNGVHRTVFEGHSPEHHHPRRDLYLNDPAPRAVLYRQARLRKRADGADGTLLVRKGLLRRLRSPSGAPPTYSQHPLYPISSRIHGSGCWTLPFKARQSKQKFTATSMSIKRGEN